MSIWFEETLHENVRQRIKVARVLTDIVTAEGQHVQIFDTPSYGRVFCLDSVIQCTEADEFSYHEMMVHVPMTAMTITDKVLIVGGASGAMAREVLKYDSVQVDLVDIDSEVLSVCKNLLPSIHCGIYNDGRVSVHICDASLWIRQHSQTYDVIFLDLPDPIGRAKKLFERDFYNYCFKALTHQGILISQTGVPFLQPQELIDIKGYLLEYFTYSGAYSVDAPYLTGGNLIFSWASNYHNLPFIGGREWHEKSNLISKTTRHYTPNLHHASFCLPKSTTTLLGKATPTSFLVADTIHLGDAQWRSSCSPNRPEISHLPLNFQPSGT
jgi:spermidine synthase